LPQRAFGQVLRRVKQVAAVRSSPELLALIPADEPTLNSPKNVALDLLCLPRADVMKSQLAGTQCSEDTVEHLNRALVLLYQSREHSYIPVALLARAELRISLGQLAGAAADLAQAAEFALFGGMKLYQADCQLESTRLHWAHYQHDRVGELRDQAWQCLAAAKNLFSTIGYRHRIPAAANLERLLRAN
jgi:hypothetical protein